MLLEEGPQGLWPLSRPGLMVTQHSLLFLGNSVSIKYLIIARDVYFESKPTEILEQDIDKQNQEAHSGRVVVQF